MFDKPDGKPKPLTPTEQLELYRAMNKKKRERTPSWPPGIKNVRIDGSRGGLMLVDFDATCRIGMQDMIRERIMAEHSDYVCSASWNKLGDQLILVLRGAKRHDPNVRRRAQGDLPQILSDLYNKRF
jgi:hypothetical protein